jgi:hypothetical protein
MPAIRNFGNARQRFYLRFYMFILQSYPCGTHSAHLGAFGGL